MLAQNQLQQEDSIWLANTSLSSLICGGCNYPLPSKIEHLHFQRSEGIFVSQKIRALKNDEVALSGTKSMPCHAQIVYHFRSLWLFPLSLLLAWLLTLLPGQSEVYKFGNYFNGIKVLVYAVDIASIADQRMPSLLSTDRRNP